MAHDIKVMVIGDASVGKTCMLLTYTTNSFPEEYVPTVFDNYNANALVDGTAVVLGMWDTAGSDEYSTLRPCSYSGTDVFLVCFSVVDPTSFDSVMQKWYPEITQYVEGKPPIIVVGLKCDLRTHASTIKQLELEGEEPISREMGLQLKEKIGAHKYMECSAKTQEGLSKVFEEAIRVVLFPPTPPSPTPSGSKMKLFKNRLFGKKDKKDKDGKKKDKDGKKT
eukprot:Phypoly_transcript_16297.p1 GENE.Phypoly_transcript_16297~~Phypoly_transcript_16297.p1  ORF type:complete len:223 (+),score=36.17 Phypoly_transcript_16297:150-818(+)